jgi:hypothetical protein
MKAVRLLSLVVLLSSYAVARAHDPSQHGPHHDRVVTSVDARLLGQFEGVIDFCSKADSQSAAKYRSIGRSLTGDISSRDLDEARESSAYRQVFNRITSLLLAIPKNDRKPACASMFTPS